MVQSGNQPPTAICSFYRPPDQDIEYLDQFCEQIKYVKECYKPSHIIIGGDFNLPSINWEQHSVPTGIPNRKQCSLLVDSILDLGMKQMVEKETRGKNTLDLFITDRPSLVQKVTTGPGLSDHRTVIVDHQPQANINKRTPHKVQNG